MINLRLESGFLPKAIGVLMFLAGVCYLVKEHVKFHLISPDFVHLVYRNSNMLHPITDHFSSNPKQHFLVDSLGALVTAFLSGIVLSRFEEIFGMPQHVLYYLAIIAVIFFIYSACCYFFIGENWRPFLKAIAVANLLYCIVTTGLIFLFYSQLTSVGLLYFIGEIGVIAVLVRIELKTAKLPLE